jgi:hypothetical protein
MIYERALAAERNEHESTLMAAAAERQKYADTEADGIVFCGKCGAKL